MTADTTVIATIARAAASTRCETVRGVVLVTFSDNVFRIDMPQPGFIDYP